MNPLMIIFMLFFANMAFTKSIPFLKGFNVANIKPGGVGLKNATDWDLAFSTIKSLPGDFNAARVYSTTDGEGDSMHLYLPDILPMAAKTNMQLLLGLWIGNDERFSRELQALHDGIKQFGNGMQKSIVAISVGNEDLYRNETDAAALVGRIAEVRAMLDQNDLGFGGCDQIPLITHTDTWDQWVKKENSAVINALDFVTMNAFPFWQENVGIDIANDSLCTSITMVKNVTAKAKNGPIEVWLGETGWPVNFNHSNSIGSLDNLQRYWNDVVCGKNSSDGSLFHNMNAFFYTDRDYWTLESFGVLGPDNQPLINLQC